MKVQQKQWGELQVEHPSGEEAAWREEEGNEKKINDQPMTYQLPTNDQPMNHINKTNRTWNKYNTNP